MLFLYVQLQKTITQQALNHRPRASSDPSHRERSFTRVADDRNVQRKTSTVVSDKVSPTVSPVTDTRSNT